MSPPRRHGGSPQPSLGLPPTIQVKGKPRGCGYRCIGRTCLDRKFMRLLALSVVKGYGLGLGRPNAGARVCQGH